MAFRMLLISVVSISILYAVTVRRGEWGMREENVLEVTASGYMPFGTRVFAEQRIPEYACGLGWLEPALELVHCVDVRLRSGYWHEMDVPDFMGAPDFDLTR